MVRRVFKVGERFGYLTVDGDEVAEWDHKTGVYRYFYSCVCDCGNRVVRRKDRLARGNGSCGCKSCGRTHGLSGDGLYKRWRGIIDRCTKSNRTGWHNYGGRGVTVCDEWVQDYYAFRDWALANGYADHLQIDRIDNNGDYCPENCRWVTNRENSNNRRDTLYVSAFGETKIVSDWTNDPRCVVNPSVLRGRLSIGWDPETAMTTPVRTRKQLKLTKT